MADGVRINTAEGVASLAALERNGKYQGVAQFPVGRVPMGATYHVVASTVGTVAAAASADMALLTMDPGAAMRWSAIATANGSIGLLLAAAGSFPEALELVGSQMLSGFRYALNAGETVTGRFYIEYYRFIL